MGITKAGQERVREMRKRAGQADRRCRAIGVVPFEERTDGIMADRLRAEIAEIEARLPADRRPSVMPDWNPDGTLPAILTDEDALAERLSWCYTRRMYYQF